MRWLRLLAAAAFLGQGIASADPIAYWAAAFFGIQAVFNTGCCAVGSCATSPIRKNIGTNDPTYQRIG
jgi:hypothetical protein